MQNGVDLEERVVGRSAALEGDEAPGSVLIAPWGEVVSANGTFVVDQESAQAVVEAFAAQGTDLPIDYEHQSLGGAYASPSGQAPAAGWIRALRAVSPSEAGGEAAGLFAEVAWTDAARARLVAREYRYLSPVVLVRRSDRRMVGLHSAALTNKPAIIGMRPIVNGRPETPGERLEMLRMRLGLDSSSSVEAVLVAAENRLAAAEDRLTELQQAALEREAEGRVASAARAGKLPGNLRAWAMSLAVRDPAAFEAWASAAPVVVSLGRMAAPRDATEPGGKSRLAVIAAARASFRSEPALALLTSEEAWVEEALRESAR